MGINYQDNWECNFNGTIKMGEVISHVCGACGENHPHLLNISALFVAFAGYYSYIKCKIQSLWKKN